MSKCKKNCNGNGICNEVTLPADKRPCHKMGCDFNVECCEIGQNGKGCAPGAKSESACTIHHEGKWHPITTYECQCKPGWSGEDCGKKDPVSCAALENCSGHGSCVEVQGRDAKCRCEPGFAGKICNQARCPQNYFYNVHLDDCEPCTSCDADSIVEPGKECTGYTTSDNPCVPLKKCQPGEFVNSSNKCQKCRTCEPGWTPAGTCGGKFDTVCKKIECDKGYFYEDGACTPCTKCLPGKHVQPGTECDGTTTLDNMCVDMDQKKSAVCSGVRTDRGGAFEFQGKINGYIYGDKSCLPCSNCVDGFCKPGQYFNGRTLKCESCRTCVDFDFHKGLKPNQPPCDGTRTTNNLCVQLCRDNQYAKAGQVDWIVGHESGVSTGKYPGAVWWNEMTCHNCDTCASGKTEINPCNGNTFYNNACQDHDTFWCGVDEDTCTWDKNADPYYTGRGQTSDWGNDAAQWQACRKYSEHMTGDPQLYSKPGGDPHFKTIVSPPWYKTYMLGCTIPDQYKGSTACAKKVNKQDCNKSTGCTWCGGDNPNCRPINKDTLLNCELSDSVTCDIVQEGEGDHVCGAGCTWCDKIGPACVPSDSYDRVCKLWP